MKQLLPFLLVAFLLSACQKEKQFVLDGKVSNYTKAYALFVHDSIGYGISTTVDTIKIDSSGNFGFQTKPHPSNSLLIFHGEKPLRITLPKALQTPLTIDLDLSEPDSIEIQGEQALLVQYHLDQQKYWAEIFERLSKTYPELATGNKTANYHKAQDTITKLRMEYLETYFKGSTVLNQEDFITAERNSLLYSNLYYRMSGEKSDIVGQLKFYQTPGNSSAAILNYSDQVSFSDKNLFSIYTYRDFVNNTIMEVVRFENPKSDLTSYELYLNKGLEIIDRWYQEPELNKIQKMIFIDYLLSTAKTFKDAVNIAAFSQAIEVLKDGYANASLAVIEDELHQLDDLLAKFSVGSKAPDFELRDREGKVYDLAYFKGKKVFFDVWASWCGPCIAAFPKWNKLVESAANNKDLVFLSVSMDKEKTKWIESLGKYDLKGLKLHVGPGEFESSFAKSFEIKSLPNYIAIDGQGNILSVSASIEEFQKIIEQ